MAVSYFADISALLTGMEAQANNYVRSPLSVAWVFPNGFRLRSCVFILILIFFSSIPSSSMFLFLLLPALFHAALVVADPIHITLARSSHSHNRNLSDYHAIAEGIRSKYNYSTAAQLSASTRGVHGVLKRTSVASVSIINQVPSTVLALLKHSHISPRTRTLAI